MSQPFPTYDEEISFEYRESFEHREPPDIPTVTCRECGEVVYEDETLDGTLCEGCAVVLGIVRCDHCGAAVAEDDATEHREAGHSGRLMTWRYCQGCEKELYA